MHWHVSFIGDLSEILYNSLVTDHDVKWRAHLGWAFLKGTMTMPGYGLVTSKSSSGRGLMGDQIWHTNSQGQGVSVQGVSVWGSLSRRSLSTGSVQVVSVFWSLSEGLCLGVSFQGDLIPRDREPVYGKDQVVSILLECILVHINLCLKSDHVKDSYVMGNFTSNTNKNM